MKKISVLAAAAVLLGCLLCGCADNAGNGGGSTDTPRVTSNVTTSPYPLNTDNLPTGGGGSGTSGNGGTGGGMSGSGQSGNAGSGNSSQGEGTGTGADSGM